MEQSHIISALVENKPGVLFAVSNMFRRRGYNIDSISVGPVERKDTARMTITVSSDEKTVGQMIKQLDKLIDVIDVRNLSRSNSVIRELALIKVATPDLQSRSEVTQFADAFRGRIIDVSYESLTIEITGDPDKIDAFIELVRKHEIREVARTGITALARGSKS